MNNRIDALVTDSKVHDQIRELGSSQSGTGGYQYATSWNPSFGYNGVWSGGEMGWYAAERGGWNETPGAANNDGVYRRSRQVIWNIAAINGSARGGSDLIMFGTSRGPRWDTSFSQIWSNGFPNPPEDTPTVEGFCSLVAPKTWLGKFDSDTSLKWTDSRPFFEYNAASKVTRFGFLSGRHFNKPLLAYFDGHVDQRSVTELWDMRRWSVAATSEFWIPPSTP
jgi:hypothetical protein